MLTPEQKQAAERAAEAIARGDLASWCEEMVEVGIFMSRFDPITGEKQYAFKPGMAEAVQRVGLEFPL